MEASSKNTAESRVRMLRKSGRRHNQGRPNEIAICGVATRAPTGLDLDDDTELVVNSVDLVGDQLHAPFAEQDRPPDALRPVLARLCFVAELHEARARDSEYLVTSQQ